MPRSRASRIRPNRRPDRFEIGDDEIRESIEKNQPGIELLFKVIDIDNILFASEMFGAVKGIDPETGYHFDHTKRYVDSLDISDEDRRKVFEGNARWVYPRLDAALKARGK